MCVKDAEGKSMLICGRSQKSSRFSEVLIILFCQVIFTFGGSANAHLPDSSSQVEAILSTDNSDELRVNKLTTITIKFKNLGNSNAKCRCRALLYSGSPSARIPPIEDQKFEVVDGGLAHINVNATLSGDYTLVIVGHPLIYGQFVDFKIDYALVATETEFDNSVWN